MSLDMQYDTTSVSLLTIEVTPNGGMSTTSEAIEKVKEQIRKLDEQMYAKLAAQNEANNNIFQTVSQDIGSLSDGSASIITLLSTKSHQILSKLRQRRGQ